MWYSHVFSLMSHTLGGQYSLSSAASYLPPGDIPEFPDIMPKFYKVGESRQMLDHAKLMMMKVCYMDPDVSFPDLLPLEETVRKAFIDYIWRYDDYDECSGTSRETHRTFMDGDNFGLGFTQIEEDEGRCHLSHAPLLNIIYDRHVLNAGRARFVGRVHHLPVETAVDMYGSSISATAAKFVSVGDPMTPAMERVKVVEYYDMGYKKWNPTRCVMLDGFGGKVLEMEDNDNECLPFAHYEMFHFSGMRRPMGRIDSQFPVQEAKNALERLIKLTLKRGSGIDLVNVTGIHPEDREMLAAGVVLPLIRLVNDSDPNKIIARVQPQDIPAGVYNYMMMLDREMNTGSGNSDGDRANLSTEDRTLGQEQLKQGGADIQTAWSRRQYAEYLKTSIQKLIKIAAVKHTAPTTLVIEGQPILFNDPQNPNSYLSRWLSKPSSVVVNEDLLQYQDPDSRAAQKINLWGKFLNDPFTNQVELRKYLFGQMGRRNVEEMVDPTGQMGGGLPQQGTQPEALGMMQPALM